MSALEQTFGTKGNLLVRTVKAGDLQAKSTIAGTVGEGELPSHAWWRCVLQGASVSVRPRGKIQTVDLFCGSGGLSLGASKAIESVGMSHVPLLAVDLERATLEVYRRNFSRTAILPANAASLVDYHVYGRGDSAEFAYPPELIDDRLSAFGGRVDLLLAGPPCQGHSNLNNHTRRSDPRNMLYMCAAAMAVALKAKMVVIESVPAVKSDKTDVVGSARTVLRNSGYVVSDGILDAKELGAAQTRKRHFLIATRKAHVGLLQAADLLKQAPMSLREAIGDLEYGSSSTGMDDIPLLSPDNKSRIDYLFDNDLYDLPNNVRPTCHKNGHTYPSVYGRLAWDKPAQTITTGFVTPGRGRYIHPSQRRPITPREAARIQGFPDSFLFGVDGSPPARGLLAKWIGEAVPSWLGYAATLAAISGY